MASPRAVWAAASVVAFALSAIASDASGAGPKPSPCAANGLTAAFTKVPNSNAAGSVIYSLRLTNKGTATCTVSGRPRLQLLDAKGKNLPTRVVGAAGKGKPGTVSIKRGKSAVASARFSPSVAAPGESQKGQCEPNAVRIRITLASPGRGSLAAAVRPPTPVCQHGNIELSPLRAHK